VNGCAGMAAVVNGESMCVCVNVEMYDVGVVVGLLSHKRATGRDGRSPIGLVNSFLGLERVNHG